MELRRDVLGLVPVVLKDVDKEVEVEQVGSYFFLASCAQNSSCHFERPESGSGVGEGV